MSSFAGLAPIHDPKIAVLVVIDEPHGEEHYGSKVAGPAFAEHHHVDDAQNRAAVAQQGDQGAEQGVAGDEAFRAVDRVDDPDVVRIRPVGAEKQARRFCPA